MMQAVARAGVESGVVCRPLELHAIRFVSIYITYTR